MQLPLLSVFAAIQSLSWSDWPGYRHRWIPAGPNDVRSPCPGLNTLANHGFISRDGKDLDVASVLRASEDVFNVLPEVLRAPAHIGMLASPTANTFTLQDIQLHNTIEHDASLSREDVAIGDAVHFNETTFTTLANSNPGSNVYNVTSAGLVMKARLDDSRKRNPNITNTFKEGFTRSLESALYITALGDVRTGEAPKEFVQIFFREERLPIKEGWKRSPVPISLVSIAPVQGGVFNISGWTPGPGPECSSMTFILEGNQTFTF